MAVLAAVLFIFLLVTNFLYFNTYLAVAVCVLYSVFTIFLVDRFILVKIASLSKFAQDLSNDTDKDKRLVFKGKDEISKLGENINKMLDSIQESSLEKIIAGEMTNAIIKNSPIGISVRSSKGTLLYYNEMWKNLWGMSDDDIHADKEERKEFKTDQKDSYMKDWILDVEKIYKEGGTLLIPQLHIQRPRIGGSIWISHYFYSILGKDGKVDRVVIMTEDITEKKFEEDRKRLKQERAKEYQDTLFELIRGGTENVMEYYAILLEKTAKAMKADLASLWFYNKDGSEAICELMFNRNEKRFEKGWTIKTDDCPLYFNSIEINRLLSVEDVYINPITSELAPTYCKNYSVISKLDVPVRTSGSIIGILSFEKTEHIYEWTDDDENFAASVSDIVSLAYETNEKEKTKKLLEESEKKYRDIVDNSLVGVFITDIEGNFLFANIAMAAILDCHSPGELMKMKAPSFYTQPQIRKNILENIKIFGRLENFELELITVKNEQKSVLLNAYFYDDTITGMMMDITEIKKAEERLASEKERLSVTLKSIGDGVIVTDMKGDVILMNAVAEELTGLAEEEASGKPVAEVFAISDRDTGNPIENPVKKALATGEIASLSEKAILMSKSGEEKILADSAAPIKDRTGRIIGAVLVFRDITEKFRIEQELFKVDKLETVGLLAGGIAHDFNNMLAGILANISLAKILKDEEEKIKFLEKAEKGVDRAKDLTTQLLVFSKGGDPVKNVVSLKDLLRETASFAVTGSKSKCEFIFSENLTNVEADPGQISQVVNNIVINADHAMPDGGIIRIEAENYSVGKVSTLPLKDGNYVRISVKDEGLGIAPENLKKIFDPFYSTKKKGSGLGLAICYTIVKNHGGHISVYSEQGKGSLFSIYLPATDAEDTTKEKIKEIVYGKGKILIMDDEPDIRESSIEMISYMGYECDSVSDGKQALSYYSDKLEKGEKYDAVILDLTVPGEMGGKEAMKLIKEIDIDAIGIVSSGYSDDPVLSNFSNYGFSGRIIKPFKIEELSELLSELLPSSKKKVMEV
ncbi:PAS domain S-box protein [candidate division WOR-3 bacterium]|nr:PAS domain S-box protein [candidate division WOR-3 bacterium]